MECHANDNISPEAQEKRTLSRRQLLKALVTAGTAATVTSFLPCQWQKPVVKVGALPVHAQMSPAPTATPTATPTPTPTATPIPVTIVSCTARDVAGGGDIAATSIIETYADINPIFAGIEMKQTITLDQPGHPAHGLVRTDTGLTDANGRFASPNFDIGALNAQAPISPGTDRLTVRWEFVDPRGSGTCARFIEIT